VHTVQPVVAVRDAPSEYRKLVAVLVSRAWRLGSRDAEAAAQESLRRSLAHPLSRAAVEYYFRERPPAGVDAPEWSLEQLLAWLHGVLRFVVREESGRVSHRREIQAADGETPDVRDPSPDILDQLIEEEQRTLVRECVSTLASDYRRVLTMRAHGLKYSEIAVRLGVNENTVATWVRRATRTVAEQVRDRMRRQPRVAIVPTAESGEGRS
jgi:RNA polymerase sigma factor (sigma-70 family)